MELDESVGQELTEFRLLGEQSVVLIEARSNVGPIAFGAHVVDGCIRLVANGGGVEMTAAPTASLSIKLDSLSSGNALFDAELLRRVDARQHPKTVVELGNAVRIGESDRYRVDGHLTFHGVRRSIDGMLEDSVPTPGRLRVVGEQVIDIRDFDITPPSRLMLRIYPDVRVQLQLEAELAIAGS